MEIALEKRMFFGNFKPRLLAMSIKEGSLFMAYKYVDTKAVKNEFQLSMNDYAQTTSKNEFEVVNDESRYNFKVSNRSSE